MYLLVMGSSVQLTALSILWGLNKPRRSEKGSPILHIGVLAAVELSSIGPNNWLRSSKSGLKGFFNCI